MKKWVFFVVVIVALGIYGRVQQKPEATGVVSTKASGQSLMINVTRDQIYQGDLLLVNTEYPVRKNSVKSDIVSLDQYRNLINGAKLADSDVRLSKNVAEKFAGMLDAAGADGVDHFIINSGYRNAKEQDKLYRDMGADYALPPNHSEHNLGLSLDIGSTLSEMNAAPEGKWLEEHAWEYGFILRYPKDKVAITGIQFEPWHFRYVGLPHSAIMRKNDFTLEQYLDYLEEQKTVATTVDNTIYEISYYPFREDLTLPMPAASHYVVSGNNADGVIVTVRESGDGK